MTYKNVYDVKVYIRPHVAPTVNLDHKLHTLDFDWTK